MQKNLSALIKMFSQFTISFQMFAPGQWKEEISIQGKKQRNIHNNFCASSAVEKVETKKKKK